MAGTRARTLSDLVDVDFPLFAFSHCRDVVAAVSRAGGFGVLGGAGFTPEQLETELTWLDGAVNGRPYGIDILVPERSRTEPGLDLAGLSDLIAPEYRDFVTRILRDHDVPPPDRSTDSRMPGSLPEVGDAYLEVAFRHPIGLVVNALGTAPDFMFERARERGIPVAALVGAKEHAIKQVRAGVDLLVAQGSEAGGHCGEVSTMVLVPEVIKAIAPIAPVPVLAAGGIMTGRQMAAAMAMGAAGAWTGSVWLATPESEVSDSLRRKLIDASSRDTVRSRYRTGKFSRQLRSAWHDIWESDDSPDPLPMPLMGLLTRPAMEAIDRAAEAGNPKARGLQTYYVGQGVGLVDGVRSCARIVHEFITDFAEAVLDLRSRL
ncbi:NAD(P)H-dependent flavin oxidoreductase [Actinophytocola sp.]|uniref:NAD(P)H-dependent flavin oxidoreductase n=1 Tax=Actinophytocola sp. TaxID=1872138 RepID=UPI003D6B2131